MPETKPALSASTVTKAGRTTFFATLARWGVAVILVGVLVNLAMAFRSLRSDTFDLVATLAPGWLLVAALLGLLPVLFHAVRIRLWSGFLGAPTNLRGALRASFGTELGAAVSPKAIGGAPVKIALLIESGQNAGTAASITLLNNLEDAVLFSLLMPIAAFLTRSWQIPQVQTAISGVAAKLSGSLPWLVGVVALVVVLVLLRRRTKRTAAPGDHPRGRLATALSGIRADFLSAWALIGQRGKLRFALAVSLTSVQWACRWSVATAVMLGLGIAVDPVLFVLLQWVVFTMMVFVPTPGAALGAEASFAAVLGAFIPAGLVGLVGAAWRFLTFYLVLVIGLGALPLLAPRRTSATS